LSPEAQHRSERAAVNLGEYAPPGRRRLVQQLHVILVDPWRILAAEQAERDRPPALHGEGPQADVGGAAQLRGALPAPVDVLAGQLEDAGVELAHDADQAADLVPARHPAGDGPAIRRLVAPRPARGGAAGAGLDRAAEVGLAA